LNSANTASPNPEHPSTAIVVGASARACAQSLVRAGITPIAIDLFADRDLKQIARTHVCPMDAYPEGIPEILRTQLADVPADVPIILTGAMENHVQVLRQIESLRPLLCGSTDAIIKSRNVDVLYHACNAVRGLPVAIQPRFPIHTPLWSLASLGKEWLVKPVHSSAGHGIVKFRIRDGIPHLTHNRDVYLQPWLDSSYFSVSELFWLDSGRAHLLGATRQIVGDSAFGTRTPTQYVGNVFSSSNRDGCLANFAQSLARYTGLRGCVGIDAMALRFENEASYWHILEVNPRYTAGMELLDLTLGNSVFDLWGKQCDPSPPDPLISCPLGKKPWSKAIVYAKEDCRVPDLLQSIPVSNVADVPQSGEHVPAGRPICTVLAQAEDFDACLCKLRELAQTVYTLCQP
jgi:uncharacterized protein